MRNKKKVQIWKISIVILSTLVLLLLVGSYFVSHKLKPLLGKRLEYTIVEYSKGLYSIKYSDLDLNIVGGYLSLKDVRLVHDSIIYKNLDLSKKAPNTRFQGRTNSLRVSGLNLWDILVKKRIQISSIELDSLKCKAILRSRSYNMDKSEKNLYDRIKNRFKSIALDEFRVNSIDLEFVNLNNEKSNSITVNGANLTVTKFLLDEQSLKDSMRILYAKDIAIHIPEFTTDLKRAPYKFRIEDFRFSSQDGMMNIGNLALQPTLNLENFAKQDKLNKPRIDMKIDSIHITGVNSQKLLLGKIFEADSMHVKGGLFELAKDKRYQKENVSKIGQSPAQQLLEVGVPISIKGVKVSHIDLSYAQISDKYFREGKIDFKNISGTFQNVSNVGSVLRKNRNMNADLQGSVYGQGQLKVQFSFDMLSDIGNYSYAGKLSAMKVSGYNRILEPLLNIRLTEGNLKAITFDMEGNDTKNWGEFNFEYDHLKVELLKDPGKGRGKKGILSFIANKFFINDSNPDANGKLHVAQVDYDRNPNHPFFKVVWKSLLQGIIECTGTDSKYFPGI